MTEAIVSAVVGEAISRVISLVTGSFSHQQSTEAKLQRICRLLIRVHSVVEEAKSRQIENPGVLQWLADLIAGEYEGRYLLDTIRCSEHDQLVDDEEDNEEQGLNKVSFPQSASSTLSLFNPAKRVRIAASAVKSVLLRRAALGACSEIDRVLDTLQGASGDLAEFIMLIQGYHPVRRPLATNIFIEGQMFGRHVEKEMIVNFLLHDNGASSTEHQLGVLPVVGVIGSGRRPCYVIATRDDATVVLRSKHVIGDAGTSLKDPFQLIKRDFHNKRFLMVFEDVEMRKKRMLEELLPSLRYGTKGSKVIFTTNNRRVASIGTVEPIVLKVLPHPEYWFFFKAHAFAGTDVEENPQLVAVGKAIARKLNGSFFGAKIVGGLLKDHPDPKFWCKVLRSNIGKLARFKDLFEPRGQLPASNQQSTEAKLQRICRLLIRIHSVVEEAKSRQIENPDVLKWLSELIAGEWGLVLKKNYRPTLALNPSSATEYEGRYLLDTIGCNERELEDDEEDGRGKLSLPQYASSTLSLFNPAKRVRIAASAVKIALSRRAALGAGDEIDRVLETMHGVSGDLAEFIMLMQGNRPVCRPLATNIFIDGQMFGRHVEKERIVNFLLHDNGASSTDQFIGVLPVVGDIGVGKTTLVQHACDDHRVRSHFPVIMLFNFSCTYAIATRDEATVVLRSKHVIGEDGMNMKDPLQLIKRDFGDKRFLMVFEDVDMRKKQMLEELLPSSRCGTCKTEERKLLGGTPCLLRPAALCYIEQGKSPRVDYTMAGSCDHIGLLLT
ncbi:hypothetical protein EJB05_01801, partial [Eragrostis curvula]